MPSESDYLPEKEVNKILEKMRSFWIFLIHEVESFQVLLIKTRQERHWKFTSTLYHSEQ